MDKKFKTRLAGLKKKAAILSTVCDVEICLVVFGQGSQAPEAVWPDGDQISKAEAVGRRYLDQLPPRRAGDDEQQQQQQLDDRQLDGLSEEGLRDLAGVLEGKLEEVRRKMEALGRRSGQGAEVDESERRIVTPPAMINGAVANSDLCNYGTIYGGTIYGGSTLLDDHEANQLIMQYCLGQGLMSTFS